MKKTFCVVALIVAAWLAINTNIPSPPESSPGSDEWLSYVSQHYFDISDGQGHGPDPGSMEWLGSVERKAKVPIRSNYSDRQRYEFIQYQLQQHTFIINSAVGLVIVL
jgi:hypothetical protein